MLFVCYPKCTTCQKARKWLDEKGVSYTLRDIKEDRPAAEELHDDVHMLFGRQRLFLDVERPDGGFACAERPVIFSPTLGGAPLNQYRRWLPLAGGVHTLLVALEPQPFESTVRWGMGIGAGNRFLFGIFR